MGEIRNALKMYVCISKVRGHKENIGLVTKIKLKYILNNV
jgi:hypothetical protein